MIAEETNAMLQAERSWKEAAKAEDDKAGKAEGFHGISDFKPKFVLASLNNNNGSKDASIIGSNEQQALL